MKLCPLHLRGGHNMLNAVVFLYRWRLKSDPCPPCDSSSRVRRTTRLLAGGDSGFVGHVVAISILWLRLSESHGWNLQWSKHQSARFLRWSRRRTAIRRARIQTRGFWDRSGRRSSYEIIRGHAAYAGYDYLYRWYGFAPDHDEDQDARVGVLPPDDMKCGEPVPAAAMRAGKNVIRIRTRVCGTPRGSARRRSC